LQDALPEFEATQREYNGLIARIDRAGREFVGLCETLEAESDKVDEARSRVWSKLVEAGATHAEASEAVRSFVKSDRSLGFVEHREIYANSWPDALRKAVGSLPSKLSTFKDYRDGMLILLRRGIPGK
jgi:hypothetical protein